MGDLRHHFPNYPFAHLPLRPTGLKRRMPAIDIQLHPANSLVAAFGLTIEDSLSPLITSLVSRWNCSRHGCRPLAWHDQRRSGSLVHVFHAVRAKQDAICEQSNIPNARQGNTRATPLSGITSLTDAYWGAAIPRECLACLHVVDASSNNWNAF